MLDPWIIEEIRRREEDKRREGATQVELPLEQPLWESEPSRRKDDEKKRERGVVVIDL